MKIYNEFIIELSNSYSLIKKDIHRTYQDSEFFQNLENQESIEKILNAYANYDEEIGYTQGMNYIVSCIFYNLDSIHFVEKSLFYFLIQIYFCLFLINLKTFYLLFHK